MRKVIFYETHKSQLQYDLRKTGLVWDASLKYKLYKMRVSVLNKTG